MMESTDGVFSIAKSNNPRRESNTFIRISIEDLYNPNLTYSICSNRNICRGHCLLINQRDFDPRTFQSRRDGTDVDADAVEKTFKLMRYEVIRTLNCSSAEMQRLFDEEAAFDHSQFDSFVCVILSHGNSNEIYARDAPIPIESIISRFRGHCCPSLIGKPKMFFIQACRGTKFDPGVNASMRTDANADLIVHKLPVEADILVGYSTVPGFFAWRNSSSGSWFIQELCKVLEQDLKRSTHTDIVALLTLVARLVAYLYKSNTGDPESHDKKQMTSIVSTLTRLAYITGSPNS